MNAETDKMPVVWRTGRRHGSAQGRGSQSVCLLVGVLIPVASHPPPLSVSKVLWYAHASPAPLVSYTR